MSSMKWMFPVVVAIAATFSAGRAGAIEPRLEVDGRSVRSFEPPAVVSVPADARHLGNRRWVLYGYADCDLHLFADVDGDMVTRLYWVQSEGYIDSRPELTHAGDYENSRKLELGGLRFHLDTWTRSRNDVAPADSDLEQVEELVAENGLALPGDMAFVRLVHLPDAAERKELMVIYAERAPAAAAPGQEAEALANMKARIEVRAAGKD